MKMSDAEEDLASSVFVVRGRLALNAAALDPRIKATVASTMYDMSRVNTKGYLRCENDSVEKRTGEQARFSCSAHV